MQRRSRWIATATLVLVVAGATAAEGGGEAAEGPDRERSSDVRPIVGPRVRPRVADLSELSLEAARSRHPTEVLRKPWLARPSAPGPATGESRDPVQQDGVRRAPAGAVASITLGAGFAGLRQGDNGRNRGVPPDPVGDIGNGYYVQAVNQVFAVFDPATGARLTAPMHQSDLYLGGACANRNDGDPIVLYDESADRFLLSQFALNFRKERYFECIAISASGDPTATWAAYAFEYPMPFLNDYPKLGVWPDGYYASFNQYKLRANGSLAWRGAGAIAYERDAMLTGAPATSIYFNLYGVDPNLGGLLPSDWDSPTTPPAGQENIYAQVDADDRYWPYFDDQMELWAFHADFVTPANSTFEQLPESPVSVANFNPWICGAPRFACVPQRNTSTKLDVLSDRLMHRLQYWNDGVIQHLVVNHTVRTASGVAGVRWYDLQNPSQQLEGWDVGDQGTFGTGTLHRWMGSAAMNDGGDLAIGYSTSRKAVFPGISVAGRATTDTAGTLPSEAVALTGTGSESGKFNRWGDYSSLNVDPVDHCTFWYTTQYYRATGQWNWGTWIQPFTVSTCP